MIRVKLKKNLGRVNLNISFEAPRSGIITFCGPSGGGKSSIVKMISGLLLPDEGYVCIGDKIFYDSSASLNVPVEKRSIGYVFQESRLFPHLNVRRNILYGCKSFDSGRFDIIVSLLGLESLLEANVEKLSGGEAQRVSIGRALLSSPDILIMDEPLASLDNSRRQELIAYISLLPSLLNIPVIYISHNHDEIMALSSYAGFVQDGALVEFGKAIKVFNSAAYLDLISATGLIGFLEGITKGEANRKYIEFCDKKLSCSYGIIGDHIRFEIAEKECRLLDMPDLSAGVPIKCVILDKEEKVGYMNLLLRFNNSYIFRLAVPMPRYSELTQGGSKIFYLHFKEPLTPRKVYVLK